MELEFGVIGVTLFEQPCCYWTIFSHWSLGWLPVLDFESNTESCRDSIQTPFSLYGTHCNFSVQCICSSFPPLHSSSLPLPVCAEFFNPWSFSTNATPSPWCWPEGTWRPLMLVLGLSSVFTQTDTHEHNAMSLAQLSTSSLIYRDKQKSVLIKEVPLERSCTQEGCSRTGEELFAVCVATERWDVHTHTQRNSHSLCELWVMYWWETLQGGYSKRGFLCRGQLVFLMRSGNALHNL